MRRKKDSNQLDIFTFLKPEEPSAPGSLNIGIRLRHAISEGIRKSGMDRIDICTAMYKLTGVETSKATLDSWSAESRDKSSENIDYNGNKRWGIPAEMVPAFCSVTGFWEPLFIQAEAGNFKALKGKDVVRARLGLLREERKKMDLEMKQLEQKLVEVGQVG